MPPAIFGGTRLQGDASELTDFFAGVFACTPEVAGLVARRAADRRFEAGAVIIRQGDRHAETFILVLGRAHALAYGRDGQLVLLQEFAPGDIFGALVEARPATSETEVVAVDPSRAAAFAALEFLGLVEAHGAIGLALSRMLLRQLHAATGRMVARTTLSATGRIYAEILRLAEASPDGRTIRPPPVLSALAVRVQSTRETVSRAVNDLERRGVIRRSDDALFVVAPHRLEELVA